MRDRSSPHPRAGRPPVSASLDVVLCTSQGRALALLLTPALAAGRERWMLPWVAFGDAQELGESAGRLAGASLGARPSWIAQVGAFGDRRRHPGGAALSIGYVAVTPARDRHLAAGAQWFPAGALPALAPRQQAIVDASVVCLRDRMDTAPVAFRLLPRTFTLTDLQEVYEVLLGRRVHKASFRRSLQAAWLVEPTDEWRSEGRGRPAQLFRYAPRKRRGDRRGVRFELPGG